MEWFVNNWNYEERLILWENDLSENTVENQIKALRYMKYKLESIDKGIYLDKLMNWYNTVEKWLILDLMFILNDLSFNLNKNNLSKLNKNNLSNLIKNLIFKIQIKNIVLWIDNILNWLENHSWDSLLDSIFYNKLIKSCELLSNIINDLRLIWGINRNTFWTNVLINEILTDN